LAFNSRPNIFFFFFPLTSYYKPPFLCRASNSYNSFLYTNLHGNFLGTPSPPQPLFYNRSLGHSQDSPPDTIILEFSYTATGQNLCEIFLSTPPWVVFPLLAALLPLAAVGHCFPSFPSIPLVFFPLVLRCPNIFLLSFFFSPTIFQNCNKSPLDNRRPPSTASGSSFTCTPIRPLRRCSCFH